ncbi:TIGR02587 family membrane protein [Phormidesmis priestleyi]
MGIAHKHDSKMWSTEFKDLVRGASGGFLFGIPLLYTMEVWWIGSFVGSARLFLALLLTFAIVFLLNQTSGFRRDSESDVDPIDAAMNTVEAMAIGIVCSGLILILMQEITLETPLQESLGKLIYESVPFTLGVALANQFLSGDGREGKPEGSAKQNQSKSGNLNATISDIGATLIGAMIIGFNIAPTDEIPMLAAAVSGLWLILVMVASLVISYVIVFAAGFSKQQQRHEQSGIFQRPMSETIAAYLVSLFAAMVMLFFFNKVLFTDPWQVWLSHTLLLGLPAAVGGAAGRLAV